MTDIAAAASEFLLYQTEDGRTRVEVRFAGDTVWLSIGQMAELFQGDKSVISVGYRVKSHRGTQFRIWATQRSTTAASPARHVPPREALLHPPAPLHRRGPAHRLSLPAQHHADGGQHDHVFDRPIHGCQSLEEVIRDNLDIGPRPRSADLRSQDPDARSYQDPRTFRTRVLTEGVQPSLRFDYKRIADRQRGERRLVAEPRVALQPLLEDAQAGAIQHDYLADPCRSRSGICFIHAGHEVAGLLDTRVSAARIYFGMIEDPVQYIEQLHLRSKLFGCRNKRTTALLQNGFGLHVRWDRNKQRAKIAEDRLAFGALESADVG